MLVFMTVTMLLVAALPSIGLGRALHRLLVETPARRLNALSPGRIAFYAALGAAGLVLFGLFELEGLRLFSLFTPELILWFGMFDVAVFLDVFILAAALGATARFRAMRAALVQGVRQIGASLRRRPAAQSRAPRARPVRADKTGSADPEPVRAVLA
ncbi:hypothetical protein [Brevundimonas pondensis]|uniref:Uncharacterized protein n=1 Tax=Brevundimonas pondensis TaxID=2774189 RepID=A0ABX7SII8_9CAUL|nr:hypothetical protein [Brevundimonas pondensis]QTC87164.1 hypothetical protein IFE19_13820 [Brevundimonas pondensis]